MDCDEVGRYRMRLCRVASVTNSTDLADIANTLCDAINRLRGDCEHLQSQLAEKDAEIERLCQTIAQFIHDESHGEPYPPKVCD